MSRPRIVVIGAVAVDVKAQSFGDLVRHADVPGRVRISMGGVAHNVAKSLALLGADATVMSVVGDDEFGRSLRADLLGAGVNADHLVTVPKHPTATWCGILNSGGELDIGIFGGEILQAISPDFVREAGLVSNHADLIALDATLPRATIDAVAARARAEHVPLYLNPASVVRAQTVCDAVGEFTLVTANALEAQVLCPAVQWSEPRRIANATLAAEDLVARGVQRTIVTLGEDGMVYADASETRHMPAPASRVVDTTGAGDALAAAFMLCHLQKRELGESLAFALRAAALTVEREESVSPVLGLLSPLLLK